MAAKKDEENNIIEDIDPASEYETEDDDHAKPSWMPTWRNNIRPITSNRKTRRRTKIKKRKTRRFKSRQSKNGRKNR